MMFLCCARLVRSPHRTPTSVCNVVCCTSVRPSIQERARRKRRKAREQFRRDREKRRRARQRDSQRKSGKKKEKKKKAKRKVVALLLCCMRWRSLAGKTRPPFTCCCTFCCCLYDVCVFLVLVSFLCQPISDRTPRQRPMGLPVVPNQQRKAPTRHFSQRTGVRLQKARVAVTMPWRVLSGSTGWTSKTRSLCVAKEFGPLECECLRVVRVRTYPCCLLLWRQYNDTAAPPRSALSRRC